MKQLHPFCKWICLHILFLTIFGSEMAVAQTAFTGPTIVTQTGSSNSYSSVVTAPETVQPSIGCGEVGANWTHNFLGTADKKLTGFTIVSTNYYVNNFGSLSTVMRRNNLSGSVNASSCGAPLGGIPWHDRQVAFYEGAEDTVNNIANLVSSFPSTTVPGSAGYNTITDMNLVFSRGFINSGADNIFNNRLGTGTGFNSNANNIERMDLFVSGGVTVTAANMNRTGIVIVCRGPADDPFTLSAIKALTGGTNSGGGTNYIYDDIIKINATWTQKSTNGGAFGALPAGSFTTLISGINSVVVRRLDTDGSLNDQLPAAQYPTVSSYVGSQNIVAMFFTFANLGLTAGEVFYGYSVAGLDVVATNSTQFNSYLNSANFPLTTDPTAGGVDLTGFPGLFSPIDIDDDDDGLPDYLEANVSSATAFGDADSDGILNYCDATYPGFVDTNTDGINDNFDPSADSDNDGIQNFKDPTFVVWGAFIDTNSDGVNDRYDWDLDGVPNHNDRDSDNDGIPDVVESFGVDANGDGVIDNYSDTDVDGLSQNVDANNTGAISSGSGLGAIDTDGDGVPNYLDHDSDNDGIPDVVEVYGTDTNNNAVIDGYTDTDGDGYSNNVDGDVGNDGTAENFAAALLRTGSDGDGNGRCDTFPNKNMDSDTKANPYDVDSDMDGILDVIEAGFSDTDFNGIIDGSFNTKGWSVGVAALGSLSLPNTDATGRINVYDIDSDDDGIPDNVEGLPTTGYMLPSNSDTDSDGLDDSYDDRVSFSGNGINPVDIDGDTTPDFRDSDTDADGVSDILEGNDLNFNNLLDDNVTLTGIDTDGDGLDDRFDNNNSSAEGTSAYMGNGGSTTGDASPGSITTVQQTPGSSMYGCATERDWRCAFYLLNCDLLIFKARLQEKTVSLNWDVLCKQEADYFILERSTDGTVFSEEETISARRIINETESYFTTDDISGISCNMIYYRLKIAMMNGRIKFSNIISVKRDIKTLQNLVIYPNPVKTNLQFQLDATESNAAKICIFNTNGKVVKQYSENINKGSNVFYYNIPSDIPTGFYCLQIKVRDQSYTAKFNLIR